LAEAIIASLQYRNRNLTKNLYLWETKVYFNSITHVMDDTKRPIVPIRMDMPGWSKTQGFYSKLLGNFRNHSFNTTLSAYRNNSLAEMTMYPNDPNEKDMFMLTWPNVNTIYGGVNVEDDISLSPHLALQIQGGIGVNYNKIRSELGLNSLQLYHPELKATKTRVLKNVSSNLSFHHGNFLHQFGVGYGDRAPSVSEAYGFYLLNTNDNFDYVGNPYLKNEKSLNFNISTMYKIEKFSAKAKVNYFYVMDYIIGKPKLDIPPMNIFANGIKIYEQLNHASIFNTSLTMDFNPFMDWTFSADASYRYGQGENNTVLPLIQPFSYRFKVKYENKSFFAEASIEGSTKNRNSIEFGETQKPSYLIANIALSKSFAIKDKNLAVKVGAQNLFNKYYSTFDNLFGIPRMGRNIYANLLFRI
jgi:iron complex outermembrane receptor protein